MNLRSLLTAFPQFGGADWGDVRVTGVTADSRHVFPGSVFVAVKGTQTDGHRYLPEAAQRGAAALVGEQEDPDLGLPYLRVEDSREALAWLAAAWYGYPASQLVMIGVTGTDGKTTTCSLIHQILLTAGHRSGMVTSVEAVIGEEIFDTGFHVTTPGALELQAFLGKMAKAGTSHAIVEATSHGLAQKRVAACDFDLAVVTNITHEHLDFHGTFEAYRAAKGELFSGLAKTPMKSHGTPRKAILNMDDGSSDYLARRTDVECISYGISAGADVRAGEIQADAEGIGFRIRGRGYDLPVRSGLVGAHNVSNCLAAFAVAVEGLGISPEDAAEGLTRLTGVPGRMERVDLGQPFGVIVDFAHTPNALAKALQTARELTGGRVIAVFGSAGLRDIEKRRLMPQVAAGLADLTILTAEDPRGESLEVILGEMAAGMQGAGSKEGDQFLRIPDRGEAIRAALLRAQPGDLVIICGKGHEQSMCFGETEYPWDDRLAARAGLADLLGVPGPAMPWLPTSTT